MKNKIKTILLDLLIFGTVYMVGSYISESYQSGYIFGSLGMTMALLVDKIRENKCEKTCTKDKNNFVN